MNSEELLHGFHDQVRTELLAFLSTRATEIAGQATEAGELVDVVTRFLQDGKYLRPTFAYLGWLSRAEESTAALRAAASLELLHAFGLIQDDVMDKSTLRRGRATVHRTLAASHADATSTSTERRFGESAAILLADLCLIWAERMLRTSGMDSQALERARSCYDDMRQELAVGQYLDLLNTERERCELPDVLRIARLKSARYTITKPLLLGAYLAGDDHKLRRVLGQYGDSIGEAFQMRDDLLGIFGEPAVTGKPAGDDLRNEKITTVVAVALDRAGPRQHRELRHLLDGDTTSTRGQDSIRDLLTETGAVEQIETMIGERVQYGRQALQHAELPERVRTELDRMALTCVDRSS
ncbi:geranylgeranyl diphosphate synthase, type I [Actinopolyspora saharensis]|uniref:Geranylgeranyl diphosphate synthase, type I n=1 Tax=Actinopolyspora saharensis TaxID=995062 RepID=A0A1H0YN75_9ACTN|nr:geranylgeranyl diphosphate synthase, type I [Actinopolyspora saharensis]